jgi:ankyrin repeat protein
MTVPAGDVYRAVLRGDLRELDHALQIGGDVNDRNDDNLWSSLMLAVATDRIDLVQRLLEEPNIDVNARSDRGQTALHLAAEGGNRRVVQLLLEQPELDVNAKDDRGWTPLTIAAFGNRIEALRSLLGHRHIAVNFVDRDRQTALHWAVLARRLDAVRELLHHPGINLAITNRPARQTAYDIARSMPVPDIASILGEQAKAPGGKDELSPGDVYRPRDLEAKPGVPMTKFIPEPPRRRSK